MVISSISVYKNVSEDSKIAFAAPLELFISTGTTYNSLPVLVADIDADGKPDLVVTSAAQYTVSILRNISTGGQIIFAEKKDFNVDAIVESYWMSPQNATVADFDGDGKLDLAFAYYSGIISQGRISIMRNLSTGNQILFGDKQFYNVDHPWRVHVGDFNNDIKPDIAVAVNAKGSTDAKQVYILGNASEPGKISFKTSGLVGRSVFANSLAIGDLDGDKKDDITVMNVETHTVSIFHNITTSFYTTFEPGIEYTLEYQTRYAAINDIDGDRKHDLAVSNGVTSKVSLLKNKSSVGAISFDKKQDYITANGSGQVLLVDLDNDGRPDMVTANKTSATISIFRNRIGEPKIVPAGDNPVTGSINKKVMVDSAVINYNGNVFVQRHYDIEPKTNPATSTARLTLYFTQQEFDNYNAYPAHGKDLPKEPADTTGIANIRIYQHHGSSSAGTPGTYTGDVAEINPADSSIRWNADSECWEVTFDVNGFSGFFLSTILADGVPLPTITSFTPAGGGTGVSVTITGTNFTGATAVSFGGTAATSFTVNSSTSITAIVGNGASGNVSVTTMGGTAGLSGFTFISSPTITSITPTSAASGATVTITGTNFTDVKAVSFGGTAASSFTVNSSTSITAVVGAGASGNVSVTTPGGTAILAGFTFIPMPIITSFTPTTGAAGTSITITGTNFTGATAVSFGGIAATSFTVNSSTSITAVVGTGASGNISITTAGGVATLAGFTFIPIPTITSFTSTSGGTGTSVIITGTNFTGATAVSFGGAAAASFTVNSSTSITAIVGTGATGNVSVTIAGGTATLAGFTFMSPPTITSFTPAKGRSAITVTITGTNFNETTAVSFGSVPAASFVINSSTSISAVVGAGASGDITVITPYGTAKAGGFAFEVGRGVNELVIYPNPADEFVLVKHPSTDLSAQLKVIDLTGKVVKVIIPDRNASETRIDLSGLKQGIYEVVWSDGKNKASQKLMLYN